MNNILMQHINNIENLYTVALDIQLLQRWINAAELKRAEYIALHSLIAYERSEQFTQLELSKHKMVVLKNRFNEKLSIIHPYILLKKPQYNY